MKSVLPKSEICHSLSPILFSTAEAAMNGDPMAALGVIGEFFLSLEPRLKKKTFTFYYPLSPTAAAGVGVVDNSIGTVDEIGKSRKIILSKRL